jgi:hypothetical protein
MDGELYDLAVLDFAYKKVLYFNLNQCHHPFVSTIIL